MGTLILPFIHVSILVGFLVYLLKSPFLDFVKNRYTETLDGLNKSKKQVAEASLKRKEIELKLAQLEQEKKIIFAEWTDRQQAQIAAVKESTVRILGQMKTDAENNKKALEESTKKSLINSIGTHTVDLVRKKIVEKLNPATHQKINEQFSKEVGGAS